MFDRWQTLIASFDYKNESFVGKEFYNLFLGYKKDFYYNTAYLKICDYCNKSLAISIFCGRQIRGTVYRSDA